MLFSELKEYLDFKSVQYNTRDFIETDPIQIPHRFNQKEDIEIIAFLVSTIAWGKRAMIIKSSERLLDIMQHSPFDFIQNYEENTIVTRMPPHSVVFQRNTIRSPQTKTRRRTARNPHLGLDLVPFPPYDATNKHGVHSIREWTLGGRRKVAGRLLSRGKSGQPVGRPDIHLWNPVDIHWCFVFCTQMESHELS